MEEKQKSAFMPSLMPGIYLGFVLIIYSLLMFLLDVDRESYINYFSYVILAAGLYWSIVSFRDKQLGGYIEFGKAFSAGFYTGLFAAVIAGIFLYIYVQYIDLGMIDEILINAEESMLEQNPDMSNEQIDQGLAMTETFTSPVMMGVFGFIANVIVSAILSLIIAIFAKRENKQVA